MAISDAAVATFETKYHYNFWRPETAIHDAALDGNDRTEPDCNFQPFVVTPCFPSYPSAHGTLSNAARDAMERIYGNVTFSITFSTPAVPGVTLTYTNLGQITDDIADARVYGGIHFRTDQDAGSQWDAGSDNGSTSTTSAVHTAATATRRATKSGHVEARARPG